MSQVCTICRHSQRLQIEQAMLSGKSLRDIEGLYGTAKTIVSRHKPHVSQSLALHSKAQETARAGTLLNDVQAGEQRAEALYQNAQDILTRAIRDNDGRLALQAIKASVDVMGQAKNFLELRGELTNELGRDRSQQAELQVQIIVPWTDPNRMPRVTYAANGEIPDGLFTEIRG